MSLKLLSFVLVLVSSSCVAFSLIFCTALIRLLMNTNFVLALRGFRDDQNWESYVLLNHDWKNYMLLNHDWENHVLLKPHCVLLSHPPGSSVVRWSAQFRDCDKRGSAIAAPIPRIQSASALPEEEIMAFPLLFLLIFHLIKPFSSLQWWRSVGSAEEGGSFQSWRDFGR